tara:strand:+ start:288 stop:1016 length:729 start_codon:yes stop_codon:yes gene_type:complete
VKEQRGNFGKRQQWPKISVICSVYNASKWLEGYLNALNNQFEDSFEVIFIDANSTDNSLEIIQKFDFRDGIKVSIIENLERISIYTAWNMGIREANGHYVMNWNTDDLLYPSALQTYTEYILRNPKVDLFYSPCCVINSQSFDNIVGMRNWPDYSHETLLKLCIGGPFPLVRKEAIEKCGFFKEKYTSSGDYEMWLNLSANKFKFKKIPDIIGCFYHRDDSVSVENLQLAQKEDREIQNLYQ